MFLTLSEWVHVAGGAAEHAVAEQQSVEDNAENHAENEIEDEGLSEGQHGSGTAWLVRSFKLHQWDGITCTDA